MKIVHNSEYSIKLNRDYPAPTIMIETDYVIELSKRRHPITREAYVHAMWDESGTIDGIRLSFGLTKNKRFLDVATSCEYEIFIVSNNATPWINTSVKSGTLTQSADRLFKVTLDSSEIGESPIGDITFLVKAEIVKGLDRYDVSQYFNHLGITDYTQFLKRKIQFLDLTKKATGEP